MCGKSDAMPPAALAQALWRNTAKPKNAGSIPARGSCLYDGAESENVLASRF